MAFAETANLAVKLTLEGNFQSQLKTAEGSLNSFKAASTNVLSGTASNLSLVKTAAISTGQAIKGMGVHLKNVLTGPLGMIGLGAGLFTVAGAIHAGIDEAQSFGLEVQKLQGITAQTVEQTSALAAALDHFGISGDAAVKTVGMLAKNIGTIQNSKAGFTGFAKEFGISLTDAKGHVVSFNEEVLRTADYFNNRSIPYQTKALALQKLYGRSWQQLVPFLQAGRKGITEAEQAAKDLGLTLTKQNLVDLKNYRESFLTLGDAMKGLQLQVGLVLMPLLSDLAKSVTSFLANGGREKIVGFFRDAAQTAKDFGSVVTGTIIPTISGLASTAQNFWNAIPAPLRDLLLKGFIADRTIHFLFGVSPLNLGKDLLGAIAGPILGRIGGSLFQRGGSPLNPLFVTQVGGLPGLPGGPGSLIPEAAGGIFSGLGGLSAAAIGQLALLAAVPVIPLVATYFLTGGAPAIAAADYKARQGTAAARGLDPANVPFYGGRGDTNRNIVADWYAQHSAALPVHIIGPDMEQLRGGIGDALAKAEARAKEVHDAILADRRARGTTSANANANPAIRALLTMEHQLSFLAGHHTGAQDIAVAHDLAIGFEGRNTSPASIVKAINELKADQKHVSASEARTIGGYIARMQTALTAALKTQKTATNILSTAARHDAETSASIQRLVAPAPKVNIKTGAVTTNVKVSVNVTAGGIHKTIVAQSRWGPATGSRYSGVGQSVPGGL